MEKIKTRNFPHSPENRAFCDVMWKNIVEAGRPQMAK